MNLIVIAVVVVVLIGFVGAAILSFASKVFAVPVDETFVKLRAELPGANCGGCGFAGCDDYANALSEDHTLSCSKCPVGGTDVATKLGDILGVSAGAGEKQVAVVQCNGTKEAAKALLTYNDIKTCKAAKQLFGGMNACPFGCLGLGDCTAACEFDAIHICDGVAVVNRNDCVACGACATACPNNLIRISPAKNLVIVQCANKAKGGEARKACSNACIGCGKCEKTCKFDAIHVEDNLAFIDPEKCKNCGMCAKECPTGAIVNMKVKKAKPAAPKAEAAPAPAKEAAPAEENAQA